MTSDTAVLVRKPGGQPTTADSFWARVDRSGDCWLWMGRTDEDGYGRVGYHQHNSTGAHRVACALAHDGDLPDQFVLHRCDKPPCVRPDHLFLGDATDNNRDRHRKGRTRGWAGREGAAHHAYKATPDITLQIFGMRADGATQNAIAEATGISRGHVSKILTRKTTTSRKVA